MGIGTDPLDDLFFVRGNEVISLFDCGHVLAVYKAMPATANSALCKAVCCFYRPRNWVSWC